MQSEPNNHEQMAYVSKDKKAVAVSKWDNLGIGLSGICLIHCLTTPLALPLLPLLRHESHENSFHLLLFLPLAFIAGLAFWQGYRKHRQFRSLFIFITGLALLLISLIVAPTQGGLHWNLSVMLSIAGSLFLLAAHYWNRKSCH